MLGIPWMDKCESPDHFPWRDATEDLVRRTETLIGLWPEQMHHMFWAPRVNQALERIDNTNRVTEHALERKRAWGLQ